MTDSIGLRRAVRLVGILNLIYFGIEFAVARYIGSVSLFADSIDFLEDASVNFLILVALGWSASGRARVGRCARRYPAYPWIIRPLDGVAKILSAVLPAPIPLSLAGAARSQ